MDESLLKELSHPDADQRVEAAWRLGEICNPAEKVVAALKKALFDDELSARGAAAEALGRIGSCDTEAVPPILELMDRETDEMSRARCVFALGRAGSNAARAVHVLLEILRTDDTHVYDTTLWALAEIGDYSDAVVEAITKGLKRSLSGKRWVAAKALGRIGSAASLSVQTLIETLKDVHPLIRELSAWALGEIGAGRAIAPLRLLAERDPCPEVCYRAQSAINLILGHPVGDQEDRPGSGKDSPHEDTAAEKAAALRQELSALDPVQRCKILKDLGEMGPPAINILSDLIPFLNDPDHTVVSSAALAVAKIGVNSPEAADALVALLDHAPRGILSSLDWAVGLVGPRALKALPYLKRQLAEYSGSAHSNLEVRYHATWALARIDYLGEEIIPSLVTSLGDEDSDVRCMAAENLGYIGPASAAAVGALEKLKEDVHPIVRRKAEWALQRIEDT